ncbi:MAG TPA: MscL family protein [Methanosarcina sp.]|nr:MscL family protein [Methanosarcina sp.]
MGLLSEFTDFLYEYKVIPLAIAFITGIASTALIKSLVDNIVIRLSHLLCLGEPGKLQLSNSGQ